MRKRSSRRVRSIYRERRMVAAVFLLAATIAAFSCCIAFTARAGECNSRSKHYTSIEIASGQSLWSIADEYMTEEYESKHDYMDEVARLNHLSNMDEIHAGEHLTVPYYASADSR